MASDIPEPGVQDDARASESALLSGLRSAIASHGDLDQSQIDEILGVNGSALESYTSDPDDPSY